MSFSFTTGATNSVYRDTGGFNMGTGNPVPFTLAFWIKIGVGALPSVVGPISYIDDSGSAHNSIVYVISNSTWSGGKSFLMTIGAGGNDDSAGSDALSALDSGAWNHVALVWQGAPTNASQWLIYFNGVESTDQQVATSNNDYNLTFNRVVFGRVAADAPVHKQAEIGLWKAALSAANINLLYTNKYSPKLVDVANLRHYWSLRNSDSGQGLNDGQGTANLTNGGATSDAGDHPAGIIYSLGAATKYDVPTTVVDGTVRKIFIGSDQTFGTLLVNGATVTASGGHFKYTDPAAPVGSAKPAMLTGFGANAAASANGGPCWATGISE